VMIIAMPAGIIDTTYIKHGLQRIKDLEWSSTRKRGKQVSADKDTQNDKSCV
jgi:hypothetical protein